MRARSFRTNTRGFLNLCVFFNVMCVCCFFSTSVNDCVLLLLIFFQCGCVFAIKRTLIKNNLNKK